MNTIRSVLLAFVAALALCVGSTPGQCGTSYTEITFGLQAHRDSVPVIAVVTHCDEDACIAEVDFVDTAPPERIMVQSDTTRDPQPAARGSLRMHLLEQRR